MLKFSEVKEQYSIIDIANRLGIEQVRRRGAVIDCRCPKHEDRNPSFWLDTRTNRAGCFRVGCFEGGDIFDLVQWHQGVSRYDSLTWIAGEEPAAKPQAIVKPERKDENRYSEWINSVHSRSRDKAYMHARYMQSRGLPIAAALAYQVGTVEGWQPSSIRYRFLDGSEIPLLPATRYLIPWIIDGQTAAIKLRLDEDSARRVLSATPKSLIDRVIENEQIARQVSEVTEAHLIDVLFGGRYLSNGTQTNRVFRYPAMDSTVRELFACEGEYDCMALTHVLNVPAVAAKDGVRNHSGLLVWIEDNDKDTVTKDRRYKAGREGALMAIRKSGKELGKDAVILTPPDGYKDIGDMLKAGILHDWFFEERKQIA